MKFTDVKHRLPVALVRNNGHYAGLTTIIIEKEQCTLYIYENGIVKQFVKQWNVDETDIHHNNTRPWLSSDSRWRLTSFKDDIDCCGENKNGNEKETENEPDTKHKKGRRVGCGALKIIPHEHKPLLDADMLHKTMKSFVEYVGENKDAVRGGGNGPKNLGVGTFYWITQFALPEL